MQELTKPLGAKIKQARKDKGLTQKDLGDYLGYSPMAISHFENGIRELKFSDLSKVATYLNRDLNFFLASGQTLFRVDNQSPEKSEMEKSVADFDRFLQQHP